MKSKDDLSKELQSNGYAGLFRRPDSRQRIDQLWSKPEAPERLLQLSLDNTNPWIARFLAAEIIFHRQVFMIRPEHHARLARLYVKSFLENASGYMSDWGFLSGPNDPGILGSRLILFGPDSDAPLRPLLDNEDEVAYVYPPEFPSEMRFGLRLKDFVALYLSTIHSISIQLTEDADQRDREIQRLKGLLP